MVHPSSLPYAGRPSSLGRHPAPALTEVEQRDLADYDHVFGLAEVMA